MARKFIQPIFVFLCAGVLMSPSASAYYHFLRYLSRTGPFVQVPQKYDLNALPNRTLNYFISEQGPTSLAPNDTYAGIVSQIRLAAKTWNDVDSSDLRLVFGGVSESNNAAGAAVDVVFTDDIPPGLNAYTVLQTGDLVNTSGSPFVAINRATVMLPRNLSQRPSFGEAFFLTAVHEFGHALGLQHTLTSSVMSTEITRAMSRSKSLGADDIAGLSVLYPVRAALAQTGSISGRVTIGSDGVAMASVVVLPANGYAISALTNPDGSYRIEGIPPGQYAVYAHSLPATMQGEATPANIVLPMGADGRPVAAGAGFEAQFYPSGRTPNFAVAVTAGGSADNINFSVSQRRAQTPISAVQTYSFIGQVTVKPATLNRTTGSGFLVAAGTGLFSSATSLTPGLTVSTVGSNGGTLAGSPRPYEVSASYAQLDLSLNPSTIDGHHHLLFTTANDLYVLPSGYQVASKAPPSISAVAPAVDATGARMIALSGTGFDRDSTRFYFDGQPAAVRSWDDAGGRVLVTPPPAAAGHRAAVVAVNNDGQSSLFAQGNNVPFYTYDAGDTAPFSISPSSLTAGSETMVEITGSSLNLIDGMARIGFGTNDVTVRRVWVTGSNRMLANISVSGSAVSRALPVTIASGLQVVTQPSGLTIQPTNPRQILLLPQVLNPLTGQTALTPGSPAMLFTLNLPAGTTATGLTLTLNDQPLQVTSFANGQITFQIPPATLGGPAVLRLRTASEAAQPIVIHIEPPPPVVLGMQASGALVDTTRPVRAGDVVTVFVAGMVADAFTSSVDKDAVIVNVAGIEHPAIQVNTAANQRGVHEVVFILKDTVTPGSYQLTVTQDSRTSGPAILPVR